jgi:U3 small nucleolar RNA-associated protein 19
MYETESKRRIKKEPAFVFDLPQRALFPSPAENVDDNGEMDRLATLWTFA